MNANETARRNIIAIAGFQRLSYRELARKANMSHVVLMRRINNEKLFDLNQLQNIADALGVENELLIASVIELPTSTRVA